MKDREFDCWMRDQIIKPAQDKWGRGWGLLSPEQKTDALLAEAMRRLFGSGRLETVATSEPDAIAFGRHGARVTQAIFAYCAELDS